MDIDEMLTDKPFSYSQKRLQAFSYRLPYRRVTGKRVTGIRNQTFGLGLTVDDLRHVSVPLFMRNLPTHCRSRSVTP